MSANKLVNMEYDMMVLDEFHHLSSVGDKQANGSYLDALKINAKMWLSLTATMKNVVSNKAGVSVVSNLDCEKFGKIVVQKNISWAIKKQYICPYRVENVEPMEKSLKDKIACIADIAWNTIFSKKCHHVLVIMNTMEQCKKFTKLVERKNKIEGLYVGHHISDTSKKEKDETYDRFVQAKCGILSTVYSLGEGWDCPILDGVIIGDNMTANTRILQSIMRPCRLDAKDPNKIGKIIIPRTKYHSELHNVLQLFQVIENEKDGVYTTIVNSRSPVTQKYVGKILQEDDIQGFDEDSDEEVEQINGIW